MSPQVLAALIGFVGLIIGAIPTYVYMRQRKIAEVGKLDAETDKIRAEAEKIRAEFRAVTALQQPRVKLLFAAAEPADLDRLRLGDEIRGITRGLRTASNGARFEVEQLWGVRWTDLRTQLLRDTPDILHISGHAAKDGLIFEGDSGYADIIPTEQVVALLSLFSDRLRLVVINTMHVESLCETLSRTIDYVVGISSSVTDSSAVDFSAAFYEALAGGKSIKIAFEIAVAYSRAGENAYKLFAERKTAEPHLLAAKSATV